MWLIAGLGNPDAKYEGTRHNVGFMVLDALAERAQASLSEKKFKARMGKARIHGQDAVLIAPQTYMNLSGESVGPAMGFYKLDVSQVIVIHDELDLELGKNRLKKGGGHGGHNGLRSLMTHLPSPDFIRVRFGIGRPPAGRDPADYVLSRFQKSEQPAVDKSVQACAEAIESVIKDGLSRAMNTFNRDPSEGQGSQKKPPRPSAERTPSPGDGASEGEALTKKERANGHDG
ncbi:MAG: aminoacyl-tRNA hydrolase [Myxococcota bacterium]